MDGVLHQYIDYIMKLTINVMKPFSFPYPLDSSSIEIMFALVFHSEW